jgi:AcrR family transcriptional regulator
MAKSRSPRPRLDSATRNKAVRPRAIVQGENGRLALIRAAERLMSARGIDAVSLREVSAAAGHANNSAVGYHFGTRDALIDAILERHSTPIHQRWSAQLDLLARHPPTSVRPYVELLVVEIANKLDDADGGWEFISISAQLSVAPLGPLVTRSIANADAVARLIGAMLPHYAAPTSLLAARLELLASTLYASLVARHRAERDGAAAVGREVFVSDLIDSLTALVLSTPSSDTLAALTSEEPRAAKAQRRTRPKTSQGS